MKCGGKDSQQNSGKARCSASAYRNAHASVFETFLSPYSLSFVISDLYSDSSEDPGLNAWNRQGK